MREIPGSFSLRLTGKRLQRRDATADGTMIPAGEEARGGARIRVVPQMLEVILQHVDGGEPAVGRQQFPEPHAILRLDVLAVAQEEPAGAFDHLAGLGVAPDAVGLVHADPVDHLAPVLGDDVEQIVDNHGLRTVGAHFFFVRRVHVHHDGLQPLCSPRAPAARRRDGRPRGCGPRRPRARVCATARPPPSRSGGPSAARIHPSQSRSRSRGPRGASCSASAATSRFFTVSQSSP